MRQVGGEQRGESEPRGAWSHHQWSHRALDILGTGEAETLAEIIVRESVSLTCGSSTLECAQVTWLNRKIRVAKS